MSFLGDLLQLLVISGVSLVSILCITCGVFTKKETKNSICECGKDLGEEII